MNHHSGDSTPMTDELTAFPTRTGHFLLESGMHSDTWSDLEGLFVEHAAIAPAVSLLAERLRVHEVQGVCGPLVGGAFLAQLLAQELGLDFYHGEPGNSGASQGLFTATYLIPASQAQRARRQRIAVVDDAISAGSSARACTDALEKAGARVVVVGALVAFGETAINHFAARRIPVVALARKAYHLWPPSECPLCADGVALTDPRVSATAPPHGRPM